MNNNSKARLPQISQEVNANKTGQNLVDERDAFSPTYESGGDDNGQATGEEGDYEDGASAT